MSARPEPLLAVRQLKIQYRLRPKRPWAPALVLRAVDEINFNLMPGETLGLVGESGSGKSTLARALVGLNPITAGSARFQGQELAGLDARAWRALRREIQMVFQDPQASLDPRMRILEIVAEPLDYLMPELGRDARRQRASETLERVGLNAALHARFPHELSGGQCQRVGIARALVVKPQLLICDEAVSALDVSVQAQVLDLLLSLRRESSVSMLFITHDLAVARQVSDRVMVMYFGRVMEQATTELLFEQPRHPYTKALLASVPGSDHTLRRQLLLAGEAPDLSVPASGCAFVTRCPMADEQCNRRVPPVQRLDDGAAVACHYVAGTQSWSPSRAAPEQRGL